MSGFARGRGGAAPAPPPPPSPFADLPARPTLKPGVDNTAKPAPTGGTADCMPLPADTAFGVPYPFQIFQNPKYVIIINEYPGTFRIIPLNQPHRADAADDPTWMGDSVGHWEGDTLVIDTIGYNGMHSIGGIQEPSDEFHTIERLTRVNGKDIFYEIIFEDPQKATGAVARNANVLRRSAGRREQGAGIRLREQSRLSAALRRPGAVGAGCGAWWAWTVAIGDLGILDC
jgi:hypothetical protein